MKLTNKSKILMSHFLDNGCIPHIPRSKKADAIVLKLYEDLKEADTFIQHKKEDPAFYKFKITKIVSVSHIPKPNMFNASSFPIEIRNQIDHFATYDICYTFSLFKRQITIHFVIEDDKVEINIDKYNEYVDKILVWLYIVNEYSSKKCSEKITLFLYMTSLNKELPKTNIHILDQNNVNTAFTYTCPKVSEIIVFRKEEWFKVLMHETFHNFALDFSDMNTEKCNERILSTFQVDSDVNLYEAYTEFWAKIWNSVFSGYYLLQDKESTQDFLTNFTFFIQFERNFGFFQMVKALEFMGLQYTDLYSKNPQSESMRSTLYKEKTNVLAYYIITLVLINNYQGFLVWCDENNTSLLQFKKTTGNIGSFCSFIEHNYKVKSMLKGVECMEKYLRTLLSSMNKSSRAMKKKELEYVLNNMRMTISELG